MIIFSLSKIKLVFFPLETYAEVIISSCNKLQQEVPAYHTLQMYIFAFSYSDSGIILAL